LISRNNKLGDVVDFIRGITFKPEDVVGVKEENAVVCMRTKNIQEELEVDDLIAVPESFVRRDELLLEEGDILISSANSWNLVGKVARVPALPYRATAGGFIAIVRAKPGAIEPNYLYRWLASEANQAAIRACGRQTTNISNLSVPRFLDLPIALPEWPDQVRAATILDKADSLRRKRQESIRLADEFLKAVFFDRFATKPRSSLLTDYCDFLAGFAFKSDQYIEPRDGAHLLRGINVGIDRFEWGDSAGYPLSAVNDLARYRLEKGDVVLAMDRPWISTGLKCAVVDERVAGSYLVQRVARLRPKQKGMSAFIMNCLQGRDFKSHCRITETTIPHISPKDFATFPVPTATEAEMRSFADIATRIQRVASRAEQAAMSSDELKASLQATIFDMH
jgi:type I restriction enzyme S subunit